MSEQKNLTNDQVKKLQQMLVDKMQNGGIDNIAGNQQKVAKPKDVSMRKLFSTLLGKMNNWVKFIDQFTSFVINKNSVDAEGVLSSARSPIIFGVYVILVFVVGGTIWSATAPLDSATVAIGTVISNTKKRAINHQEGGIIKAIHVAIGDHVKKDEILLELESSRVIADYESTLNQYRTLVANEARLSAILAGENELIFPAELTADKNVETVGKIIATQTSLFRSNKEVKKAEKESLEQTIKQSRKQIEAYESKKIASKKTLEVHNERLDAIKKLTNQGYSQKSTLLEMEAKQANFISDIAITDTEIAKTEQDITRKEIELLNLESKLMEKNLTELKENQSQLASVREKLISSKDILDRAVIKSPVDGVVNQIHYYTVGSYIQPSQPIIEVSPSDDTLVIEAKIDPKNIDSIHTGLLSKIRFSAFKSRTTPLFHGKVISLSPDIVMPAPGVALPDPKLGSGYYIAQIAIDLDEFAEIAKTRSLELVPGMQAEVQIVTGTRTLLGYLLDPLYDAMFKGFKEK